MNAAGHTNPKFLKADCSAAPAKVPIFETSNRCLIGSL